MASSAKYIKVADLYLYYRFDGLVSPKTARNTFKSVSKYSYAIDLRIRCMSCGTDPTPAEFRGPNAYELLGVSEDSSFKEIKASFYKLAKETHPDLAKNIADDSASRRFVQILAAYEILSDSDKRSHYDQYLLSIQTLANDHPREGQVVYKYESYKPPMEMEVVDWLKWYRDAVSDLVSEKRIVDGSSYYDELERDFYSALHTAYYGPDIESLDFLPDCFEAEERSGKETPEVLHLVSGRDLFGIVRVADRVLKLSDSHYEKLMIGDDWDNLDTASDEYFPKIDSNGVVSDAYKDLELHVAGKLVAVATRAPPKEDIQDSIQVYLTSYEGVTKMTRRSRKDYDMDFSVQSRIPLGSIDGLGTTPEEGCCYVHNKIGVNTHMIMKHRTFLVKHMHWYQVCDNDSVCECRSTRAQLPPSRFWLFEPRSGMHDIGGWYVETFGRDEKGRSIPTRRFWDGLDAYEERISNFRRLHPAMYLLALAYRTLDIEDSRRQNKTMKNIMERKVLRILSWCKKLL